MTEQLQLLIIDTVGFVILHFFITKLRRLRSIIINDSRKTRIPFVYFN